MPQSYILISIIVLFLIMVVLIFVRQKMRKPLSGLAKASFLFVIAGAVFSDDRLVGYGLMGVGIILAVVDIVKKSGSKQTF